MGAGNSRKSSQLRQTLFKSLRQSPENLLFTEVQIDISENNSNNKITITSQFLDEKLNTVFLPDCRVSSTLYFIHCNMKS